MIKNSTSKRGSNFLLILRKNIINLPYAWLIQPPLAPPC